MTINQETIQLAPRDIEAKHADDCKRIGKTQVLFAINSDGALVVWARCPTCGPCKIVPE